VEQCPIKAESLLVLVMDAKQMKKSDTCCFASCTGNLKQAMQKVVITFRVSRRRREMYGDHACLRVCLSLYLSVRGRMPTLLHVPGCNLGCYGNKTRTRNVSEYTLVLALCLVEILLKNHL